MKTLFTVIVILFFVISPAHAGIWGESVTFDDLSDQRSFSSPDYDPPSSEGGLSGYWSGSFIIEWDITQDLSTLLWTYEYTISTSCKDVSHFILEFTERTTANDSIAILINGAAVTFGNEIEGMDYWGEHPGNPDYPSTTDIYGFKFDVGGDQVTYSFTTGLDPVWGNFYAKGGKTKVDNNKINMVAYNTALGITDFDSDNSLDFIVRPNGGSSPPVVPEPISSILFIAGGAVLTGRGYLKRKETA